MQRRKFLQSILAITTLVAIKPSYAIFGLGSGASGGATEWTQLANNALLLKSQVIAKATPKYDYYIKQEYGSRLIQFDFGKTTLKYCGVSGSEEVAQFKQQQGAICQNLVDF